VQGDGGGYDGARVTTGQQLSRRGNFLVLCHLFRAMTTANKITILRILLIPFFVVEIIYYVRTGNEVYRLAGVLAFAVSAILDGVDGYVARHYHQQSELGTSSTARGQIAAGVRHRVVELR